MLFSFILVIIQLIPFCFSDLLVHCEWPSMEGSWLLELTSSTYDHSVLYKCQLSSPLPPPMTFKTKKILTLSPPNIIMDGDVNVMGREEEKNGSFTLIYDQGMEITLDEKIYFMFFRFEEVKKENKTVVVSYCNETFLGWFHDKEEKKGEYPGNWGCVKATKLNDGNNNVNYYDIVEESDSDGEKVYVPSEEEIVEMNRNNNMFESVKYSDEMYKKIDDSLKNNRRRKVYEKPKPEKKMGQKEIDLLLEDFPKNFDWRDVEGVNYVSPVRDQEHCGSCYAFGSTAMFEARIRLESNNTLKPIFSPQDLVDCSTYGQGCSGGFPYLMSRWGEDYGIVEEFCDPYVGKDEKCTPHCLTREERWLTYDTGYVGGYYGNEYLMVKEIYEEGPISISFEVYQDLRSYKHGVYIHNSTETPPPPHWEITNHVVMISGYGVTEDGVKFWNVKNSWGSTWGNEGYFSIIRGVDNCNIESMAVHAKVVKH